MEKFISNILEADVEGEMKKKGGILFGKEKDEITIRSSAAEYLPPCSNSAGLISGFSVPESAKAVVEYLGAVVQPVAHDSKVLHNASAVAVHVGEQLIRHGRSFGAGRVLYRSD